MRRQRARFFSLTALATLTTLIVAACGSSSASTTGNGTKPILVGISEPLTGDFSADGLACARGYELWASDVNSHGGLLGRQVELKIVNDKSDPVTTTKQYKTLITQDHVDMVMGPFSSLLTAAAAPAVAKLGYSFVEGSGGAPAVFGLKEHNLFAVSPAVQEQMVPFANWVASLPASQRPTTAAYPMVSDPFADPPVQTAQTVLAAHGVRTVYSKIITATNLKPFAQAVARTNAQAVLLGTVDVPSVLAFIHVFQAMHYTPKMLIAASGPDQGAEFLNHVGNANATGIMVPDGWFGGFQNALSHVMVQEYIAKFGGTASGINADVAESYSSGEVLADAINGTHSLNQAKIISYLHSHKLTTVQGPAKFNSVGINTVALEFIFQWQAGQFLQVLPLGSVGSSTIEATKQPWLSG